MRARDLIERGSPCDVDFTDKEIQSLGDVEQRGRVPCSNYAECQKRSRAEEIKCSRRAAMEMAGFILRNKSPFEKAVEEEEYGFLTDSASEGKFWVFRDGIWQVVEGKEKVIEDIVVFAQIIIDRQPGERRPFTQDGTKTEFGPADAMHNAMLDLDDVYGEVGHVNPFR